MLIALSCLIVRPKHRTDPMQRRAFIEPSIFVMKACDKKKGWGFVINPYDHCVANKDINGEQCTVDCHVDDLKISHKDPDVVTSILNLLSAEFGREATLTITLGKVHDYLGMRFDYSEPGKVKVTMIDYIDNMLAELPRDMDGEAVTSASNHPFTGNENPVKLDTEEADFS